MFFDSGFLNFNLVSAAFITKAFLVLLLVFYTVFALVLFRQTQLMAKTLPTMLSPLLKFLAIIHIGVALALLFIILGVF